MNRLVSRKLWVYFGTLKTPCEPKVRDPWGFLSSFWLHVDQTLVENNRFSRQSQVPLFYTFRVYAQCLP